MRTNVYWTELLTCASTAASESSSTSGSSTSSTSSSSTTLLSSTTTTTPLGLGLGNDIIQGHINLILRHFGGIFCLKIRIFNNSSSNWTLNSGLTKWRKYYWRTNTDYHSVHLVVCFLIEKGHFALPIIKAPR